MAFAGLKGPNAIAIGGLKTEGGKCAGGGNECGLCEWWDACAAAAAKTDLALPWCAGGGRALKFINWETF